MSTSWPDVQVKLSVIENDEEVLSAEGKGHVVLPSFIFHRDPASVDDEPALVQSVSRSCKISESFMCTTH